MTETDAFERLLAHEVRTAFGPERSLHAAAIVRAVTAEATETRVRPRATPGRFTVALAVLMVATVGAVLYGLRVDRSAMPAAVNGPGIEGARGTHVPVAVSGTISAV